MSGRTFSRLRRRAIWPIAVAVTVALAACGSSSSAKVGKDWAEVQSLSKSEGQAVMYTTDPDEWGQAVGAAFQKSTGVTMTVGVRGAGGTIEARLAAEEKAGAVKADVFSTTDRDFFAQHKDWFVNLADAGLPNYSKYPKQFTFQDVCAVKTLYISGILYNSKLVPAADVPTSWKDVLNPYWKGKTIIYDPRASNTALGWAIQMRKKYGDSFLKGIAAQNPQYSPSSIPAAEQVSSGAYQITYLSNADSSGDLVQKGAPIKFVIGSDPTIGSAGCVGILKDAAHPNAARDLVNYLLTSEAQSAACVQGGLKQGSPLDAKGCVQIPDGWSPTPVDPKTGQIEGTSDPKQKAQVLGDLGIK